MTEDGHGDVVGHDQRAAEEHQAAECTHHVVREQRCDRFREGIDEEALGIVFAPHQRLLDTGHPHDGGVDDDADRGEPEVPVDQLQAVETLPAPQLGVR